MKKTLVSMRIMQWMLAAILMTSGLGMLSSCQQIVEEQLQEVICQWVADFAEEGIDPETGLAYNRVVEVYDFSENNAGYYECYLLNGDELVNAEYVRGENGDFRYEVEGGLDYRSTIKQRKMDVCLDIKIVLLDWSYWWTVRYDDGLIDDGYHVLTPATEAQREQILKWYESRHTTGLAEKIIGKWIVADLRGTPALTNEKMVTTFVSTTKAIVSSSKADYSKADNKWNVYREDDVVITGNTVTLTGHPNEHTTLINEYIVSSISDTELMGKWKHITTVDGVETVNTEFDIRLVKVDSDYRADILGLWQGQVTSTQDTYGDGKEHRWKYKADGNFVYYVKDGDDWVPSANTLNEYFVDGNLLCMRWIDNDVEYREWWEIDIDDDKMNWTALRQNPGGEPFTVTFEMTLVPGIALIAKGGQIDYWRQIETAFRSICQDKGFNAYYSSTSADNAYYEQIAAVEELSRCREDALKGIIFAPCYGPDGESAEAEVAALASERGIPVIILDVPVSTTSPLASRPFIGTDNTAAGKALAENVTADKVIAFAKVNTPGVERAQAFMTVKPETELITVSESAVSEVEAALGDYDDFVFFNGSNLVDVLATLKNAGKRVYTFDIYGDFLDELIAGGTCLQGIMAQNTFAMARRAVDAVLADSQQGQFVPAFYITTSNIASPDVLPYLLYYNKLD